MNTNQNRARAVDWMVGSCVRKSDGTTNPNGTVNAYVAGTSFSVTAATNASPIIVTTATAHRLTSGSVINLIGVIGNTAANGYQTITTPSSIATISAATHASPIVLTTTAHGLATGAIVTVAGVVGNTAANGTWTVTVVDATHLSLDGSTGSGAWLGGGTVTVANMFSLNSSTGSGVYTSGGTVYPTLALWQTQDKLTSWGTNCVVNLDANGRPTFPVFADGRYCFAVHDSGGALLYTIDNAFYGYETVSVKDFGAKGDAQLNGSVWTGTDDTAAINQAIAYCLSYASATPDSTTRLYFPSGAYLISNSLQVTLVSGTLTTGGTYDAACIELYGDHRAFPVGVSSLYQRGSYIVQASNLVPAVCIQNSRGITIRNLGFIGQNIFPSNYTFNSLINDATFVNRGCRDDLWSPYAAIAIDPYKDNRPAQPSTITGASNAAPIVITTAAAHGLVTNARVNITGVLGNTAANGTCTITFVSATTFSLNGSTGNGPWTSGGTVYPIPPTTYGYPGQSAYYVNGTASSAVTIDGCSFEQFVVGVVIAPTASGGNTENIFLRDCTFLRHRIAVAVCQNQARNVVIENVSAADQQFFITTRIYGHGGNYFGGAPPFIHKANIGGTKYIFNIDLSAQNFHVAGMYVESTLSLGYIGTGNIAAGNLGATFTGCSFSFWTLPNEQIDFHFFNFAPVEFRGCAFFAGDSIQPLVFDNFAPLTFAETALMPTAQPAGTFPLAFQNAALVRFDNARFYDTTLAMGFANMTSDYDTTGPNALPSRQPLASPDYIIEGTRLRVIGTKLKSFSIGSGPLNSNGSGGQATFTPTSTAVLMVGDLVYISTGSATTYNSQWYDTQGVAGSAGTTSAFAGVIKTIAAGVITLQYMPDSITVGSAGNYTLEVRYFARYHPLTYGTLSNASPTITSVSPDPANSVWKASDRIDHPAPIPRIPAGTYVTDASVANQLTISASATGAATAAPLVDADTVTEQLDGSGNFASAAIKTTRYPSTRKLLWLVQAASSSEGGTRLYATATGAEITWNAGWDGANWTRDVNATLAVKFEVLSSGMNYRSISAGSSSWSDSAWDGTASLTTSAGLAALFAPTGSALTVGNSSAGASPLSLDAGTTGALTLGRSTDTNTINIGGGNSANTKTQTIKIGAGTPSGTGKADVTIGQTAGQGTVTLGQSTDTNTINIGAGNTADTNIQTINIGSGTGVTTGKSVVTVGSTANASSLTLQSGTGAINIGHSSHARTINVGTGAAAQAVNIATGAAGNTVTIGSTTSTTTLRFRAANSNIMFTTPGTTVAPSNFVFDIGPAVPNTTGGVGVLILPKCVTNPTGNTTAGGTLWVGKSGSGSDGTLRYRGTATETQLAPAGPHCIACGYDAWRVAQVNHQWKSWHFECAHCDAEYKGGPATVHGQLSEFERQLYLKPGMTWEEMLRVWSGEFPGYVEPSDKTGG